MFQAQKWRPWLILAAGLLLVVCVEAVASACPTCKDALAANDPQRQNLVRGYGWSIIFMMSMPFLIFTCLTSYFYYLVVLDRRKRAKLALQLAEAKSCEVRETTPAEVPAERELLNV